MKRCLYLASNAAHIRNFHLESIRALRDCGCSVDVGCRDVPAELEGADHCIEIPFAKHISFYRNRDAVRRLRQLLSNEKYDLLFCNTSLAAFFARFVLLGRRERPFVINMVHGYLFDENTPFPKRLLLSGAESMTAPVTDLILTMNEWDTDCALRKKWGRSVRKTDGMGFVLSRFPELTEDKTALRRRLSLPEGAFLLVFPAEFSTRKNQSFLIRLLESLPENIFLALPGDGALLTACRRLASERGLESRVLFPGYQADLNLWLRAADLAVSASRSEGLPSSVIEGMFCSLPVVASDVKGHRDLVRHGQTGFLCKDERDWRDRILTLAADQKLRERMGAAGRRIAETYAREDCVDRLMRLLRDQRILGAAVETESDTLPATR